MRRVDVDPSIFAFPADLTTETINARVAALAAWSKFQGENGWLTLCLSAVAGKRLKESGYLPAYGPVSVALKNSGIQQYSATDVISVIYSVLQNSVSGAHCCVTDELHSNFTSVPTQPWHAPCSLDSITENALVLSHIERSLHQDGRLTRFLSFLETTDLQFDSSLEMVDPTGLHGFSSTELPVIIHDVVLVVKTVEQFLSSLAPEQVWAHSIGAADLKLAIKLKCREKLLSSNEYAGLQKIPRFYVGSDFFASLQERECDGTRKYATQTLDCCAAAVLSLPTLEIKDFRKNPRKADQARPLRAHITEGGAAMRLMMWRRAPEKPHNTIEFANVGRKHEEEISYSDPAAAV